MGVTRSVSDALARLSAAYAAAGIAPPSPAGDVDDDIDQIKRAIEPLTLPAQLEDFWRQVDPWTLTLMPWPEPVRPHRSLDLWQDFLRETKQAHRLFFPVCHQGADFLFVELEDGHALGGACIFWAATWGSYELKAASLADYLDLVAQFIEAGEFERQDPAPPYFDPEDRWDDAVAASMPPPRSVRGFEQDLRVEDEPGSWPEHWTLSDRLAFHGPREHLATIEDLAIAAEENGTAQGTVRVRVLGSTPSALGPLWFLADASASIQALCSAPIPDVGAGWEKVMELDIIVRKLGSTTDWGEVGDAMTALVARGDLEHAASVGRTARFGEFDKKARAEVTAIRSTN